MWFGELLVSEGPGSCAGASLATFAALRRFAPPSARPTSFSGPIWKKPGEIRHPIAGGKTDFRGTRILNFSPALLLLSPALLLLFPRIFSLFYRLPSPHIFLQELLIPACPPVQDRTPNKVCSVQLLLDLLRSRYFLRAEN